jgi:hypothetical protein
MSILRVTRRRLLALAGAVPGSAGIAAAAGAAGSHPRTQAEIDAGVVPTNPSWQPGCPERYIAEGFTYCSDGTGSGGSDFYPAITTALSIGQQAVHLGPNRYLCKSGTIVLPPEQGFHGAGLNLTSIIYPPTLTAVGNAIGWNNRNAAKIETSGYTVYCNGTHGTTLTGGMVLGTNQNPYGTEGFIDQIMIRDLPANKLGFDIFCNVGEFGNIYALNTAGIRLQGSGISIVALENTNPSGFMDQNGNRTATQIQDGWIGLFELEAPQSSIILLTTVGNLVIDYFVPSLARSTTFAHLIDLSPRAANWEINVRQIYYGGANWRANQPTFTSLFYDRGANAYFGAGNPSASTSPKQMCGQFSSGLTTHGATFAVKKQQLNNFALLAVNNSGTIQHKITAPGQSGLAAGWATSIAGANPVFTNTPTGPDSSTAFAFGGKISSANPQLFLLNSGAEIPSDVILHSSITLNSTGTAYNVRATLVNLSVNGVSQNWLALQLTGATSGSNIPWATALGTSGWSLEIEFLGFVK